jgi:hypothetical protein
MPLLLLAVQMGTMAALLPLGLKLVYLQELAHLNPLIPSQYLQLCRRIYRILNENSGKVNCAAMCSLGAGGALWQ